MKKYFKYYAISWAIVLAVFNVIIFTVTAETVGFEAVTVSFWIGYAFITIAFVGNLVCSLLFFKEENKGKIFLNLPIITISYSALCISLVIGTIAMAVPSIPYWVGIIVDVLVLAFYAIAILKASAVADIVSDIDKKIKTQKFFIKSLTVDAETLMARAKSDDIKAEAKRVYEAIRYSDPMSNEAFASVEAQITIKFNEFSQAVENDSVDESKTKSAELLILINDRNKKCKLLK